MNAMDIIKRRRSTRQFIEKAIPVEVLQDILLAGIQAPSGCNSQNWRFLLIDNREEVGFLGKMKNPTCLTRSATAWIMVFCDTHAHRGYKEEEAKIWEKIWYHNCASAIQNMLLVATEHKLGSCWISFVKEMDRTRLLRGYTFREIFSNYEIPSYYEPHGLVLLGYPKYKDKDGYPLGDKKHGLNPVERKPIEAYLIRKKR